MVSYTVLNRLQQRKIFTAIGGKTTPYVPYVKGLSERIEKSIRDLAKY